MEKSHQNVFPNGTTSITPNRVTSGVAHFRGLAPGRSSFEETPLPWRSVGDTDQFDLSVIDPKTFRTETDVFTLCADRQIREL